MQSLIILVSDTLAASSALLTLDFPIVTSLFKHRQHNVAQQIITVVLANTQSGLYSIHVCFKYIVYVVGWGCGVKMEEGVYQLGHAHELSSLFAELTMLDNADEVNFSVIRDLDLVVLNIAS